MKREMTILALASGFLAVCGVASALPGDVSNLRGADSATEPSGTFVQATPACHNWTHIQFEDTDLPLSSLIFVELHLGEAPELIERVQDFKGFACQSENLIVEKRFRYPVSRTRLNGTMEILSYQTRTTEFRSVATNLGIYQRFFEWDGGLEASHFDGQWHVTSNGPHDIPSTGRFLVTTDAEVRLCHERDCGDGGILVRSTSN